MREHLLSMLLQLTPDGPLVGQVDFVQMEVILLLHGLLGS